MRQYQLVVKDSRGELINEVEKLLKEGWQLVGGVSMTPLSEKVANGRDRFWSVQAMAK